MKDSKKKSIATGVVGVAAGVAGTFGAEELKEYIDLQGESETVAQQQPQVEEHKPEEHEEADVQTSQHTGGSSHHDDVAEITPVDSAENGDVVIVTDTDDVPEELIDVNPDEIAQMLTEEEEDDDENLLALHEVEEWDENDEEPEESEEPADDEEDDDDDELYAESDEEDEADDGDMVDDIL